MITQLIENGSLDAFLGVFLVLEYLLDLAANFLALMSIVEQAAGSRTYSGKVYHVSDARWHDFLRYRRWKHVQCVNDPWEVLIELDS